MRWVRRVAAAVATGAASALSLIATGAVVVPDTVVAVIGAIGTIAGVFTPTPKRRRVSAPNGVQEK